MEPKISVIIPLYNAEKYIRECLISVLASKFKDYEVLVVDDCSTDNSLAEVKKILPHFEGRLRILSTEKNSGGPGKPRTIGIKNATGKYITFIDNDDMILPDALDLFFDTAEFYDADVLHTEKCLGFIGDSKKLQISPLGMPERFVDKPTFEPADLTGRMRHLIYERFYCVPWGKFFRKDFLLENEIYFPSDIQFGEDYVFCFKCLCLAKKYILVPYVTNAHRVGIVSASNWVASSPQKLVSLMLKVMVKKISLLDEFMCGLEFFNNNPSWHYDVIKFTMDEDFLIMKNSLKSLKSYEVQKTFFDVLQNPELDPEGKNLLTTYLYAEQSLTR